MKHIKRYNPAVHGNRKTSFRKAISILAVVIGLGLMLGITACQSGGDATPNPVEATQPAGETQNEPDEASASQPGDTSDDQPEDTPAEVEQPGV